MEGERSVSLLSLQQVRSALDRPWECLAGEAQVSCDHVRIKRVAETGRHVVTCACSASWFEYPLLVSAK